MVHHIVIVDNATLQRVSDWAQKRNEGGWQGICGRIFDARAGEPRMRRLLEIAFDHLQRGNVTPTPETIAQELARMLRLDIVASPAQRALLEIDRALGIDKP